MVRDDITRPNGAIVTQNLPRVPLSWSLWLGCSGRRSSSMHFSCALGGFLGVAGFMMSTSASADLFLAAIVTMCLALIWFRPGFIFVGGR